MSWRAMLLAVLCLGACTKQRTQIMVGLATDLKAKGEIDEVLFTAWRVDDNGQKIEPPTILQSWTLTDVPSEVYELPGSIGLYSPDGSEPRVLVNVEGRKNGVELVTREAIFSLVKEQTLFLRLTLVSACMNASQCSGDQVCIEGDCRPRVIDSRRLPKYREPALGEPSQVTTLECIGAIQYINSNTGELMVASSSCKGQAICQEGVCLNPLPEELPDLSVPGHGGSDGFPSFDLPPQPSRDYTAITGTKEMDGTYTMYLGAVDGSIFHWRDAARTGSSQEIAFETQAPSRVRRMWMAPNGMVYAICDGGIVMRRLLDTSWEQVISFGPNHTLDGINGSASEVVIVGAVDAAALALHSTLDPFVSVLETVPGGAVGTLHSVSGPVAGHAWAVGNGRTLLHRSGNNWTAEATPPPPADGKMYDFFDIAGPLNNTYLVVGSQGQALRFTVDATGAITNQTLETIGTGATVVTVSAVPQVDQFMAATSTGEVWYSESGGPWTSIIPAGPVAYKASFGIDGFFFAVGSSATYVADRVPVVTNPDMGL